MTTPPADADTGLWVRGPVIPAEAQGRPQPQSPEWTSAVKPADRERFTVPPHVSRTGPPGGPSPTSSGSDPHTYTNAARSAVSWVNAHGGAGATTLSAALGGVDVGQNWPNVYLGNPNRFFLLARTHAAGLKAASRKMEELRKRSHPPGIELIALVLVADAPGRLPSDLSRRVKVLRSATPSFMIPWIEAWRAGKPAEKAPRAIIEIASIIQPNLEL